MCIKVPDELRDENIAVRLLEAYFADDPVTGRARYSGAYFERLGGGGDRPDTAYQLTAEDLLAVSMLSVPVDRYYALHVLYYSGREISDLLSRIPLGGLPTRPGGRGAHRPGRARLGVVAAALRHQTASRGRPTWPCGGWQVVGAKAPAVDPHLRQPRQERSQPRPHPRHVMERPALPTA